MKENNTIDEQQIKQVFTEHAANKERIRKNVLMQAESRPRHTSRVAYAVCLVLFLIVAGLSGFAITAEAKAYREAIEFFDEYKLSTEGLTRTEIKAVYKDITMETYSYGKTIDLLNDISVELYQTTLDTVDKDRLDALWELRNSYYLTAEQPSVRTDQVRYCTEYFDTSFATILQYTGEVENWRYTIPFEMYVFADENLIPCEDGVLVYGRKSGTTKVGSRACAFLLDTAGQLVWEYTLDEKHDRFEHSEYDTAVVTEDEIAFFGRCLVNHKDTDGSVQDQTYYTVFTSLDRKGNVLRNKEFENEFFTRYDTAVKLNDTYLVKSFGRPSSDDLSMKSDLLSFSTDGERMDRFRYTADGASYEIQDLHLYEGKVYLSALLPNIDEASFESQVNATSKEYYDAWTKSFENNDEMQDVQMSADYTERLTKIFSTAYNAVLLVCGDGTSVTKAYSVDNARAAKLETNEAGELTWQVMRIDDAKNVLPFLSFGRVNLLTTEFSFVFDASGTLIKQVEVGPFPMVW